MKPATCTLYTHSSKCAFEGFEEDVLFMETLDYKAFVCE